MQGTHHSEWAVSFCSSAQSVLRSMQLMTRSGGAPSTCAKPIAFRVLALGRQQAAAYTSIAHVLVGLGEIIYRDESSFRVATDCIDFAEERACDLVLMPNPYGNERRLEIYRALRQSKMPVVTFDRGGLPRSWFFDVGFNADSPSYRPHSWDRPLAANERARVRSYIEQVRSGLEPLEAQGARVGASRLREQLGIGDRKVLFVPFQRPADTTVRYFSSPMRDFAEFERLVGQVGELTRTSLRDWVVVAKKHPLETARPSPAVMFADDDAHINDLIELADAVLVLNSGAGLLSLCWDKTVLIAGTAYYADQRLNIEVQSSADVSAALRQLQSVDAETRDRFLHHLISSVYSFGNFQTELVRQSDGSLRNVTRHIEFDAVRLPLIRSRASLLYVTSVIPWPINRGSAHRTDQMLSALSAQELAIDLLCLNQSETDTADEVIAERLRQRYPALRHVMVMRHPKLARSMRPVDVWDRLRYQFAHLADATAGRSHTINCATHCPPAFARTLKARIRQVSYAAVWFNYLRVLPPDLATDAKIICDLHDFQTERIRADVLPRLPVNRRAEYLQRFKSSEARALGQCELAIAISPIEMKRIVGDLKPQARMVCVPATDFSRLSVPVLAQAEARFDLLFVGSRSDANIAGITWFLERCFPRIAEARPTVSLRIHGTIAEMPAVMQLVSPWRESGRIMISGPSEMMDDVYASSRIVICPILHGTGMKIKMIEAMAHGNAIVATSEASEGISTGLGLLPADTPEDFLAACLRLLDDVPAFERSRKASQAVFTRDHTHARVRERLGAILRELELVGRPSIGSL